MPILRLFWRFFAESTSPAFCGKRFSHFSPAYFHLFKPVFSSWGNNFPRKKWDLYVWRIRVFTPISKKKLVRVANSKNFVELLFAQKDFDDLRKTLGNLLFECLKIWRSFLKNCWIVFEDFYRKLTRNSLQKLTSLYPACFEFVWGNFCILIGRFPSKFAVVFYFVRIIFDKDFYISAFCSPQKK